MIHVEGLTKFYGPIPAIEDVSFHVERGEIIGFLGPNAAGKTTTMRILTGFLPATRGKARVAGFDVAEKPLEVKQRVGYVPENVPLYLEMVVCKYLQYVAAVKGVLRRDRGTEVGRVVGRCGLEGMEKRTIRNLSKGFRQRVGLAQALLGNPPVLILDEPTVGLDPQQIIEIRNLIAGLAEEHTILLSSHILPEVAMVCGRVLIIHQGRIVAQDSMANLAGKSDILRLEVEAVGPEEKVRAVLEGLEDVKRAEAVGPGDYQVEVARRYAGKDPRESIAEALVDARIGLRSLAVRHRTLEDVFVEAISSEKGGEPPAPSPAEKAPDAAPAEAGNEEPEPTGTPDVQEEQGPDDEPIDQAGAGEEKGES